MVSAGNIYPFALFWSDCIPFTFLQIERGKLHGCIDVGLSVMSVKKSTKCIDLDTEEQIYHLKVGLQDCYNLTPKITTLALYGGDFFFLIVGGLIVTLIVTLITYFIVSAD